MPYIYTHSEQQRKITVIVICHLRRIWARARVALRSDKSQLLCFSLRPAT